MSPATSFFDSLRKPMKTGEKLTNVSETGINFPKHLQKQTMAT